MDLAFGLLTNVELAQLTKCFAEYSDASGIRTKLGPSFHTSKKVACGVCRKKVLEFIRKFPPRMALAEHGPCLDQLIPKVTNFPGCYVVKPHNHGVKLLSYT